MGLYRRFNRNVLIIIITSLGVTALLNIVVDPLGIWNTPVYAGFNLSKPDKENHIRIFKAYDIKRFRPKVIFLGTSIAYEDGLDPLYYQTITKEPAYNLALPGANMYELKRYFQHALYYQPELKQVIIGLDFFTFNEYKPNQPDFSEEVLEKNAALNQELLNTVFSWQAVKASVKTIYLNYKQPDFQYFYSNGQMTEVAIKRLIGDRSQKDIFKGSIEGYLTYPDVYGTFRISRNRLNDLKAVVAICRELGIDIKLFISPSHASQYEAIRVAGLWEEFEEWKRELSKIAPVWDFSGYNNITVEPINYRMRNYLDSAHYRKRVGNLVLNRLLRYREGSIPKDFGILITPANVDTHLAGIRLSRESWAKDNLQVVKLVQDIKQGIDKRN